MSRENLDRVRTVYDAAARGDIDAGERRVLIHQHGSGTGRATGIVLTRDFFQIWEMRSDGLVIRVREYERREDALEAAGLSE